MRTEAVYSFEKFAPTESINSIFDGCSSLLMEWIDSKGTRDDSTNKIKFNDDRIATYKKKIISTEIGEAYEFHIMEPIRGGSFETCIEFCKSKDKICVFCSLGVGQTESIAPLTFTAKCPLLIRKILQQWTWRVGQQEISTKPDRFRSYEGGIKLSEEIKNSVRTLPIIVVSEDSGFMLMPDIDKRIMREIIGLATVASIDGDASWGLTDQLGKEFSCYSGAIRIYWPGYESISRRGQLWIHSKEHPAQDFAEKVLPAIRKIIFRTSCYSVRKNQLFNEIYIANNKAELEARIKDSNEVIAWEEFAKEYEDKNKELSDEVDRLKDQLAQSEIDLGNEKYLRSYYEELSKEKKDDVASINTVEEAISAAKVKFSASLLFGDDVEEGIKHISSDAGPPQKVYRYLEKLSDMSNLLCRGNLGLDPVNWLNRNNCTTSNESETVRNSAREKERRTWHDGADKSLFLYHMKPSDAISPDKCIRIYFKWDAGIKKVIIGWVGRHP